jgi:SynChlorMet cassette protein ScmD
VTTTERFPPPIANPVCVLREEFDDWAVLFNPDTADAVGINPVGVVVWKQLDGQCSVDEIVAAVHKQFSDVPAGAAAEVQAFIAELAERGFVGYELSEGEP